MADAQTPATESEAGSSSSANELSINIKGPAELKLQVSIAEDKSVLDLKTLIASKEGVDAPADRQRLIYSGKVLKDDDLLSKYKIRNADTIHMVKGAAKPAASSTSSSATSSGAGAPRLPTMQTGQNIHDPMTLLNGPMGHGLSLGHGALNPFAGLDVNPNDPNMMQNMMQSPAFLEQMSRMMSDPAVMDQIIAANPQLGAMAPQMRAMMQSEQFRNMLSNPQQLQAMLQMSQQLRSMGLGPPGMGDAFGGGGGLFGNPFGAGAAGGASAAFPAPGQPSYAQQQQTATQGQGNDAPAAPSSPNTGAAQQPNPFASLASLLGGVPPQGQAPAGGAGAFDPALLSGLLGLGAGAGATPAAPADARPPEERYEAQLLQLQQMGFSNAQQNVRALLATGGNVHAAVDYILGGGGL
ncbi:hypothetical protein SCHPADRAFT_866858 [Schizopora paradoxa]|uniref:Ubiquitin-domain-containing protein n=1 Tax=Schizopora paradoxa TaxID=27342 RepID=A0A0H2S2V7_9AGAM|nr:hypothetical protein SCHPADRAFT_866858 [Schizopora paradoxa]